MKISVITVTLNSGSTVRDTFMSLCGQAHTDVELVVVDGASTDTTLDIIKEFKERLGERMRYVSEPDGGIYDAMNKGLAMATGDVVGFLNSDDFYTSCHTLELVATRMAAGDVDAVYGDVHYVKRDDTSKCVRYYSSRMFRPWMMRLGFIPAHPSFYCRRDVLERYGSFDTSYRVAGDFEHLLRLIFIHRITTAYLPADFVTMRKGGVSTSGLRSHWLTTRDHLRALRSNGVRSGVLLLGLRYLYKLAELAFRKFK